MEQTKIFRGLRQCSGFEIADSTKAVSPDQP
jgi:hypothetical protein